MAPAQGLQHTVSTGVRRRWSTKLSGRSQESNLLRRLLIREHCQVVALLGIGGLGKTTLAAHTARSLADDFEVVIWRSLLNAPLLDELLSMLLRYLADPPLLDLPTSLEDKLALLLGQLRQRRCLLVLDNLETILDQNEAGRFRPGYEDYRQLLQRLGEREHRSCLLFTSRELPKQLARLARASHRVRAIQLAGLSAEAAIEIFHHHGLTATNQTVVALTRRCSGNPLALNLIAQTIQDLFLGDVDAFLTVETPVFADIREVLDQQIGRLGPREEQILYWLAVAREPMSQSTIKQSLSDPVSQQDLLEALSALQRRSLLEITQRGFTLQNVVTDYLTNRLVEQVGQEFQTGELALTDHLALLNAQASDSIRQSQTRLILAPIADRIAKTMGRDAFDRICRRLLDELRAATSVSHGYAAGNILNLLLVLGIDVTGYDFSQLTVAHAYLPGKQLANVNFGNAALVGSVFTDTFGFVYSVAIDPRGQWLAAGAVEGTVQIWHLETGQPIAQLAKHSEAVFSIAFSPDGRLLATGCADGMVRLWDTSDWQITGVLSGHDASVQAVAFQPGVLSGTGNDLLASCSADRTVRVWDVRSRETRQILHGHTDDVQALAFSPEGQILASGSRDGTIRLWQVSKPNESAVWRLASILSGHASWINGLAYSPDGQTLASACEDGSIGLWQPLPGVNSDRPNALLEGHDSGVQAVCFSPNGQTLVSGGEDHAVRLWQVQTGLTIRRLDGHEGWVRSIAFSPDGCTLASGSWDHTVRLWNVGEFGTEIAAEARLTLRGYTDWVFCVAFSPDGNTLASATSDHAVRLWEVRTGRVLRTLQGHTNWVWRVAFSPDGHTLASASFDGTVRLWRLSNGQTRRVLPNHTGGVQSVAFSYDGLQLATASVDHTVGLWDVRTGRLVRLLQQHTNWCTSVVFSPDGTLLASASADRTIILWHASTGVIHHVLRGHESGIQEVIFSRDGLTLASTGWDNTVRLWDVATGSQLKLLKGHTALAQGIAFSPDDRTLASSSYDQTVRLWDVASGELRGVLSGHSNWVFYVAFSPDGRQLASGSGDGAIKLWDMATGDCLSTWHIPRPYDGMDITGATGLTEAQRTSLKALGAIERCDMHEAVRFSGANASARSIAPD